MICSQGKFYSHVREENNQNLQRLFPPRTQSHHGPILKDTMKNSPTRTVEFHCKDVEDILHYTILKPL